MSDEVPPGRPGPSRAWTFSTQPQRIRNESWPLLDGKRRHAEGIKDQPNPIPVQVRLDFEDDGETWLDGVAQRWTRAHVYVRSIDDPRLSALRAIWVRAEDVRRRTTT